MKNIKKIAAAVLALTICCTPNLTISANDNVTQTAIIVDEPIPTETEIWVEAEPLGIVEVNQTPIKTEYTVGEEFDLTGLEISLKFYHGGEMPESQLDKYEVIYDKVNPLDYPDIFVVDTSEFDSSKPGTYKITIKGTEEATARYWMFGWGSFEVTVKEDTSSDWIPDSFDEAVEFSNTYGRTLIKDGYICMVNETMLGELVCDYVRMSYEGNCEVVYNQVYVDPGHSAYPTPDLYLPYEAPAFEVSVFKPTASGQITTRYHGSMDASEFTFNVSENNEITQTDIYGWMPDCVTEYDSFIKKNGNVLIKDGYIGFVSDICTDGGYSLFFEQSGDGAVELVEEYDFSFNIFPELPGMSCYCVRIYKPSSAGVVTLNWTTARDWEYEESVMPICKKQLVIGNDLTISNTSVKGDVNGDGEVVATDAVTFKKYLVNKGSLFAANNADLNGDNKVNVFDWLILKKQIIN